MQDLESIRGTGSLTNVNQSGFGELTSDEFVKIMFAELANQDPMKPNDSQAMLDQLSSLRSIETDQDLSEKLDQMVERSDFGAASSLIGQVISGISLRSEQVIDSVFSVSRTSEGPVLNLVGGQQVRLDDVIEVANSPSSSNE